ncbi:polycomb group protein VERNALIZATION 2 isoform X3 [Prunus yedoensis var. nudiflora]|uniref:Polycomb group protein VERNALIZATION 2 isoform X3 n=1 Tax=Prunus yedoensis var. nudiflora TaxID=2094558 RepID=A0A314YPX5_PRUYE|nr:polycomb group protein VERNALIZATION 2 isoform X3 [Prunus yedoensis var. nudiflora]
MCLQNSCAHLSAEEAVAIEESLLIYCKPVELYNILRPRALHNVFNGHCCTLVKMVPSVFL